MDAVSAADAALATNRGQVIDIVLGTVFVSSGLTACASAALRSGRGRSHPRLVGSLERHVPPPNAGAGATSSSSSAARPPVSYALREYRGHVPAFGFCPVCLAGADSWQAQRFASAGNPRRVGNRFWLVLAPSSSGMSYIAATSQSSLSGIAATNPRPIRPYPTRNPSAEHENGSQ